MNDIKTVGLLGGGVIGAGWAARCLLNGLDVVVCDLDPEAERKLGEVIANAGRAMGKISMAPPGPRGSLRITREIEDAAGGADFIQESLPEREDIKIPLLKRAAKAARPEVIIGSSTSGLLPSRLQAGIAHPERFLVGHPFNPVYLMPLVEVCGGDMTTAEVKDRAAAFYAALGMRPLMLRKEIDGFIADRLMEALWRESLWLVKDDIATAEEIDDALRFGPGLRWSFMGSFLTYRIAGGEAGMRHFMEQFGPSLKWPWTKLMDVPDLDDALLDKIVSQSDDQAGGRTIRDWERLRDDCLVSVMQGLSGHDFGAGTVLKDYGKVLFECAHETAKSAAHDPSAPLRLHTARVLPEWIDYNGHMTESRYLQVFGDGTDAVLRHIGADAEYHKHGFSYYTVETHIRHLHDVNADTPLQVETQILGADDKRLHIFHSLVAAESGTLLASAEHMLLHVDTKEGRACPAAREVLAKLEPIAEGHAKLPPPEGAGRAIAMPGPKV